METEGCCWSGCGKKKKKCYSERRDGREGFAPSRLQRRRGRAEGRKGAAAAGIWQRGLKMGHAAGA